MSKSLLKSTAVVGMMTMLSRVLGMIRDIVFAHYLGANAITDSFFVALRIPNLTRRLFAEGAFAQAFVPVLSEYRTSKSHEEAGELVSYVTGTLGGILALLTVLCVIGAPVLVLLFGYDAEQAELTTTLIRITFPYALFISLISCAGGILNSYGKFAVPAFTPVLFNISLIIVTIWIAPFFSQPVIGVATGVFVAGIIQLAFQLPFLAQIKLLKIPKWGLAYCGVKQIIRLMAPAVVGSSAAQLNIFISTVISTYLISGSVSWLYYSDRLVEFPLGVFGIAISTVILPKLSRDHIQQSPDTFSDTLDWALKLVLLFGTPAMLGLMLLSGPMIATIFEHGEFNVNSVEMASGSLIAYAIGLQGFILVKVLAPGFFARQDTKTPMKYGLANVVINIALSFSLVFVLAHVGLALATSIAALANAALLYLKLRKEGIYSPKAGWKSLMVKTVIANIGLALYLYFISPALEQWVSWGLLNRALILGGLVISAAIIYGLFLLAFGFRPKDFIH